MEMYLNQYYMYYGGITRLHWHDAHADEKKTPKQPHWAHPEGLVEPRVSIIGLVTVVTNCGHAG